MSVHVCAFVCGQVCILLGLRPSWSDMQALLEDPSLSRRLVDLQPDQIQVRPSLPLSLSPSLCPPYTWIPFQKCHRSTGYPSVQTSCPPLVSTRPLLAHPWVTIACVRHRLDPRTSPAACCKWTTWSQQWRQRPWRHSRCGSCTILVLSCLWKMQPYCCAVPLKCLTLRSVPHGAGAVSLAGRYGGLCV